MLTHCISDTILVWLMQLHQPQPSISPHFHPAYPNLCNDGAASSATPTHQKDCISDSTIQTPLSTLPNLTYLTVV